MNKMNLAFHNGQLFLELIMKRNCVPEKKTNYFIEVACSPHLNHQDQAMTFFWLYLSAHFLQERNINSYIKLQHMLYRKDYITLYYFCL